RILVKFSWHIPDFPIYSNGTKPGTLQRFTIAQASSAGYSFALSAILVTGICSATAFLSPKVFDNVI
ncbi:hypothetical protein QP979_13220, partial [Corynebacterium striatum]